MNKAETIIEKIAFFSVCVALGWQIGENISLRKKVDSTNEVKFAFWDLGYTQGLNNKKDNYEIYQSDSTLVYNKFFK